MAYTKEAMLENLKKAREIKFNKVKMHVTDNKKFIAKMQDDLSDLTLPKGKGKTGYLGVVIVDNTRRKGYGSIVKVGDSQIINYFNQDEVGLHNAITLTKKIMWDNNMCLLDVNNNRVLKNKHQEENTKMEIIAPVLHNQVIIDDLLNNSEVKAYRLATALMTLKTLNVKFRAVTEDGNTYGDLPPEIKEIEIFKKVTNKRLTWKREELRVLLSAMEKKDALRLELIEFSNGSDLRISSLQTAACTILTELFGKDSYKTHKSLVGEALEVSRN